MNDFILSAFARKFNTESALHSDRFDPEKTREGGCLLLFLKYTTLFDTMQR